MSEGTARQQEAQHRLNTLIYSPIHPNQDLSQPQEGLWRGIQLSQPSVFVFSLCEWGLTAIVFLELQGIDKIIPSVPEGNNEKLWEKQNN